MMARSSELQSEAGYICARPLSQLDDPSCDARPDHTSGHVWTTPALQEESSDWLAVGCKSCVRPIRAALMTAGPDVVRGPGPNQKHGLDTRDPKRVLPINRSTASHHAIITLAIRKSVAAGP